MLQNSMMTCLVMLLIITVTACTGGGNKKESGIRYPDATKVEVSISGMTCTGCEQTIQSGVAKLDGIIDVKADHVSGTAIVEFSSSKTDTGAIRAAITKSGYKVTGFSPATETIHNE